ncbi:hypothetical protein LV84_00981 [Algoriphagus ratkowskyi]|uniref:Membrane or secreted protein n=1 Tax=Algoriphagus ratkowskyi TaxID=57028 RepID=A0A2W7T9D0_9BACT|nr:hypothetical protein [Algoriphagus ratkowskyi]PZX59772.1 hypothetical protein LV84_00981 [Algoriphagus ratkowskyi]TXD78517.1 hypothetical protein ESW18_06915 [Algoriphagus ratkowskyi]
MKTIILFFTAFFLFSWVDAQSLDGAWKLTHQNGQEVKDMEYIKIYQDNYFAFGAKGVADNQFLSAGGGPFTLSDGKYTETLDFFTLDPLQVGKSNIYTLDWVNEKMVISSEINRKMLVEIWEKVSEEKDDLTGNWVITGRKRGEEITRSTPAARRTVKILSGGRFQWIAFNSETKEFSGTGGGTYTAKNGKYIENITFFSRDDSRVGASLDFNYEVIDGEWHHTGLSSKGDPIYEIWTPYAIGYKGK